MSKVFRSGAFVQQCFAVHPLCLSLKRTSAEQILLACSSCNMTHRLTLRSITSPVHLAAVEAQPPPAPADEGRAAERLLHCATAHPAAVRVRALDVLEDAAGLRCAECRRLYDLDIASFETHQK